MENCISFRVFRSRPGAPALRGGIFMSCSHCTRRLLAFCAALLLLLALAGPSARAAAFQKSFDVNVTFWNDGEDTVAPASDGIDPNRTATLTRQANGTYTLTLPIRSMQMLGMDCHLVGLTIGEIWYEGAVSGSFDSGSALLTIRNLPFSILTNGRADQAIDVVCSFEMDLSFLGELDADARLSVWAV